VLGPQQEWFDPGAVDALLGAPFTLTAAYDRMGVRLAGPPLPLRDALAIPSTPIVAGSVQVAGDGGATLLFADHQTTGGYPKIATVISPDRSGAAQLRAGDHVRFHAVPPAAAIRAARAAAAQRERCLDAAAHRPGLLTRSLLGTNLISGVYAAHDRNDG
jgi:allophanate hydrolase